MTIDGAMFHFHEDKPANGYFSPDKHHGVTTLIGLMVPDVDKVMTQALSAGATLLSPAQDYEYGYRQGQFVDPLGHHWLIECLLRPIP
jgi:PhnB protein